jgi:hypothetical protein
MSSAASALFSLSLRLRFDPAPLPPALGDCRSAEASAVFPESELEADWLRERTRREDMVFKVENQKYEVMVAHILEAIPPKLSALGWLHFKQMGSWR